MATATVVPAAHDRKRGNELGCGRIDRQRGRNGSSCARFEGTCTAVPTCDAGDTQIAGACAADLSCYTRTACGTSINCRKTATVDAGTTPCDPTKEPYRNDVATAPAKCAVIDYAFPPNTNGFENACGRGCQRDPACPVSVNCQPGPGSRDPLCSDGTKCPYTIRAL